MLFLLVFFFRMQKFPFFSNFSPAKSGVRMRFLWGPFFQMRITPIFTHFTNSPRILELETLYLYSRFLIKFRNFLSAGILNFQKLLPLVAKMYKNPGFFTFLPLEGAIFWKFKIPADKNNI